MCCKIFSGHRRHFYQSNLDTVCDSDDQSLARLSVLHVGLQRCIAGHTTRHLQCFDVDGANAFTKFRKLTLPLLLVAVGPLLVASFTFNFNNFNVIYLFNKGGPLHSGADTPVGYTDILISYVYKLAFGGARGSDYGSLLPLQ